MKTYKVAAIYIKNGMLVVDTTQSSMSDRHYDIAIDEREGKIYVKAERPEYEVHGFFGSVVNPELAIDEDVKLVSVWWFSKRRKKVCKNGYVEMKTRKTMHYKSNNYTLIE